MQTAKFEEAEKVCSYDPSDKRVKALSVGPVNERTVNTYCSWLIGLGVGYEVRLHHNNFYLIKSFGLNEAVKESKTDD